MKKNNSVRIGLILIALFISSVSAFGTGVDEAADDQSKPVQIRFAWWGSEGRHDATLAAVDRFMEKYPSIVVKTEPQGWGGFHDKLATQISTGNEPDVFQFANDKYMADYAEAGMLYDISDFIGSIIDTDSIDKGTLGWGSFNGTLYGIPTGMNGQTLLYNKKIFDEAGAAYPEDSWTWDDYEAAGIKIAATGKYAAVDFSTQLDYVSVLIYQMGGVIVDNNLQVVCLKELTKIYEMAERFRAEGIFPPMEETVVHNTQQDNYFVLGEAAMKFDWAATAPMFNTSLVDGNLGSIGIAMMPGSSEKPASVTSLGSMPLLIGRNSEHKEEAATLINFLINDPEAAAILKTVRGVPVSSKARTSLRSNLSEVDAMVFDAVDKLSAISLPAPAKYRVTRGGAANLGTIIQTEGEKVGFGQKTPAEAAADAVEQMQSMIDKAN